MTDLQNILALVPLLITVIINVICIRREKTRWREDALRHANHHMYRYHEHEPNHIAVSVYVDGDEDILICPKNWFSIKPFWLDNR